MNNSDYKKEIPLPNWNFEYGLGVNMSTSDKQRSKISWLPSYSTQSGGNPIQMQTIPLQAIPFKTIKEGQNFKSTSFYLSAKNYFNELFMVGDNNSNLLYNKLKNIYFNSSELTTLIKFPQIYYYFLERFNRALLSKYSDNKDTWGLKEKKQIFYNWITWSNSRIWTDNEEKIFLTLLKDETLPNIPGLSKDDTNSSWSLSSTQGEPQGNEVQNKTKIEVITMNKINDQIKTNHIINFDYVVKGVNKEMKKFLDLIDYELTLKTCLKNEKWKLVSLDLYFNNEKTPNQIKSFPNDLSMESPVTLNFKKLINRNENSISYMTIDKITVSFENNTKYVFTISTPINDKNITWIKHSKLKVLDFKYKELIKIGQNELYHFEWHLVKDPCYFFDIGKFEITFENERRRSTMTQWNPGKQAAVVPTTSLKNTWDLLSSNVSQSVMIGGNTTPKPNDTSMSSFLSSTTTQWFEKIEPVFYTKNEDGTISEGTKKITFTYSNWEDRLKEGQNKISFLIQLKDTGNYSILFSTKYSICKKELNDDYIDIPEKIGRINFESVKQFPTSFTTFANMYMKSGKAINFPLDSPMKISFILMNNWDTNIIIRNVSTKIHEKTPTEITSPIYDIINSSIPVKDQILTLWKSSEYVIPFNCVFKEEFSASFGEIIIDWTTDKWLEFDRNAVNTSTFPLQTVNTKMFEIILYLVRSNYRKESNEIEIEVKVINKVNALKKATLLIDNNNSSFFVNGFVSKNIMLKPQEEKLVEFKWIPLLKGNIKLPALKIMEFSFKEREAKLNSVYYHPDYIYIEP